MVVGVALDRSGALGRVVRSILTRLVRADDGQALSEYGVLLALVAGARMIERFAWRLMDDPRAPWVGGVLVVLLIASLMRRRS